MFGMGAKLGLLHQDEHMLKAFKNEVLRNIIGPKRDEVTVVEETPSQGAF